MRTQMFHSEEIDCGGELWDRGSGSGSPGGVARSANHGGIGKYVGIIF